MNKPNAQDRKDKKKLTILLNCLSLTNNMSPSSTLNYIYTVDI